MLPDDYIFGIGDAWNEQDVNYETLSSFKIGRRFEKYWEENI